MKLSALLAAGVRTFVDLTEKGELRPYDGVLHEEAERAGVDAAWHRMPIRDVSVPTVEQMRRIQELIVASIASGKPVYVHCWGGVGRPGTNESSSASFYLFKAEAVTIGDSAPAPLFTLIVGPSEEGREVGETKKEMAERHVLRQRFWTGLLAHARTKTNLHSGVSPNTYSSDARLPERCERLLAAPIPQGVVAGTRRRAALTRTLPRTHAHVHPRGESSSRRVAPIQDNRHDGRPPQRLPATPWPPLGFSTPS